VLGPAILFISAGNDVRGNVVTDNAGGGIAAASQLGTGNTIIGNFAQDNTRFGGFDLFDGNTNCDSNVWRGNDFGTANQFCIH
jgi:parallel beta-helix repeat protein